MKIVFMGSAPISAQVLHALLAHPATVELAGVVTQPDRPKGRGGLVAASPVRLLAESCSLPVLAPERVNAPEVLAEINAFRPDVIVVVAYGQFLGRTLLGLPHKGCVNLHTSLLPRWRGAAPVQRAIANGDPVTGVTIMKMNEAMDAGDILAQRECNIGREDTAAGVLERLAELGSLLMVETLDLLNKGDVVGVTQDEALATFAPKLKKEEGRIDWTLSAETLYNRVRAFNSWPVVSCGMGDGTDARLQVYRACVESSNTGEPGELLDVAGAGPLVATGRDALRLLDVQAPGRKRMSGSAFLCGQRLKRGMKLV